MKECQNSMIQSLCRFLIRNETKIWPIRFVNQNFTNIFSPFFVSFDFKFIIRHVDCELDENCPFVIMLQCIEEQIDMIKWSTKTQTKEKIYQILCLIDDHCSGFLHFADFGGNLSCHLTDRARILIQTLQISKFDANINMDIYFYSIRIQTKSLKMLNDV